MMKHKFVITADGSYTIFNEKIGENYHSIHGALQESKHVFINAGLNFIFDKLPNKEISILEVGFGTGLNFILTAEEANNHQRKLYYTGIEAYPLSKEDLGQLSYNKYVANDIWDEFISIYDASFCQEANLLDLVTLTIKKTKLENFVPNKQYDLIYYDAFSNIHQPEMWSFERISQIVNCLKPGGVLVTYAVTGNLKRYLKANFCEIERLAGPPGKREMLRAQKNIN